MEPDNKKSIVNVTTAQMLKATPEETVKTAKLIYIYIFGYVTSNFGLDSPFRQSGPLPVNG
jgi:hypothetical protein